MTKDTVKKHVLFPLLIALLNQYFFICPARLFLVQDLECVVSTKHLYIYICMYVYMYACMYICICMYLFLFLFLPMRVSNKSQSFSCLRSEV